MLTARETASPLFDVDGCGQQIAAALNHFHLLNPVHNDVRKCHVMFKTQESEEAAITSPVSTLVVYRGIQLGGNLDQRTRTFIPSNLRTTSMLWRFFAKDSNLPRTGKTVAHVASAYLQQDCWTLPRPLAGRNWRNRSGKAAHSSMFARLLLFGLAFLVKRKS